MGVFREIADRVWVGRYEWADANITAIGTRAGLVVVDTHGSVAAGRRVLADLGRDVPGPVAAVVNTHWHWDHTFGNAAFREVDPTVPIHAHAAAVEELSEHGEHMRRRLAEAGGPHAEEVADSELVLPDHPFSTSTVLDLEDRHVELLFAGRAHTAGDLLVRVADVDLVCAGDLVEESALPWIGMDSWPLEWPETLGSVLGWTAPGATVVPGHGFPVDRAFVAEQRDAIAAIVAQVRLLHGAGVTVDDAAEAGEWPWPVDDRVRNAVRRGYEHLGPAGSAPRS